MSSLDGCSVRRLLSPMDIARARAFIAENEWLASRGKDPSLGHLWHCYGLMTGSDELMGVVSFSAGPARTRYYLAKDQADKVVCLERGACAYWAHPHAGSFLVSRACRMAVDDHGWELFYAYSDPAAGEIGTIYQACNWLYLGHGKGHREKGSTRYGVRPPGVKEGDYLNYISTRRLWQSGRVRDELAAHCLATRGVEYTGKGAFQLARELGYVIEPDRPKKHLYAMAPVRKRQWLKRLKVIEWEPKPYPKRA